MAAAAAVAALAAGLATSVYAAAAPRVAADNFDIFYL
jgi:hypothetical protein